MELPLPLDFSPRRILVAPLNWGLGHASRSADVVLRLRSQYPDAEIILASDGVAAAWLRHRFPELQVLDLPSYGIRYGRGRSVLPAMVLSAPRMIRAVVTEHRMVQRMIRSYGIDLVISDNRFGLWSRLCPCVIITHQLALMPPAGKHTPLTRLADAINRWFLRRYHHCWVPDDAAYPGMAGELSHPSTMPRKVHYIGPLSRFHRMTPDAHPGEEGSDILCIVSGPEPQREIFLNTLLDQLHLLPVNTTIVAGTPGTTVNRETPPHVRIYPHLDDKAMLAAIRAAKMIVSRSGYSTIMDLRCTGGKALFVPTPGQTEQEYLATLCHEQGSAIVQTQDSINLREAFSSITGMNPEGQKR
jgi:uncharacterized protein (TIGR00661 family)